MAIRSSRDWEDPRWPRHKMCGEVIGTRSVDFIMARGHAYRIVRGRTHDRTWTKLLIFHFFLAPRRSSTHGYRGRRAEPNAGAGTPRVRPHHMTPARAGLSAPASPIHATRWHRSSRDRADGHRAFRRDVQSGPTLW